MVCKASARLTRGVIFFPYIYIYMKCNGMQGLYA